MKIRFRREKDFAGVITLKYLTESGFGFIGIKEPFGSILKSRVMLLHFGRES